MIELQASTFKEGNYMQHVGLYFYDWKQKCYVNHSCIILIIYINVITFWWMKDPVVFFCTINFCASFLLKLLLHYNMQHTFYTKHRVETTFRLFRQVLHCSNLIRYFYYTVLN